MKLIPLSQGKSTQIDDEDFPKVGHLKWYVNYGYAVRNIRRPDGTYTLERMNRVLLQAPDGMEVDHRNGDKLDNRKENLRIVTPRQNQWNLGIRKDNKCGAKGVYWSKQCKQYAAHMKHGGKSLHLGYFKNVEQAAMAYDAAALQLRGEHACVNFDQATGRNRIVELSWALACAVSCAERNF